jgi:hypothetical protein
MPGKRDERPLVPSGFALTRLACPCKRSSSAVGLANMAGNFRGSCVAISGNNASMLYNQTGDAFDTSIRASRDPQPVKFLGRLFGLERDVNLRNLRQCRAGVFLFLGRLLATPGACRIIGRFSVRRNSTSEAGTTGLHLLS